MTKTIIGLAFYLASLTAYAATPSKLSYKNEKLAQAFEYHYDLLQVKPLKDRHKSRKRQASSQHSFYPGAKMEHEDADTRALRRQGGKTHSSHYAAVLQAAKTTGKAAAVTAAQALYPHALEPQLHQGNKPFRHNPTHIARALVAERE